MTDAETFLRLAFAQAPTDEAVAAISPTREEQGDLKRYELILPRGEVRADLLRELPKLMYYLEWVGAKPPGFGGVVLLVFSGDTVHFVHARDAVTLLAEWSGASLEELRRRYGLR